MKEGWGGGAQDSGEGLQGGLHEATISTERHNQIPLVLASCPEDQWGQRFGGGTLGRVGTAAQGRIPG